MASQREFFRAKTWILHAWRKRHLEEAGEQNPKEDDDDRFPSFFSEESEH